MTTNRDHVPTTPPLGRYEIDVGNSAVTFTIRHLFGMASVRGTIAIRSGAVDVVEPITDSRVQVDIDLASFHTGTTQRDGTVRSARFLDAERYVDVAMEIQCVRV